MRWFLVGVLLLSLGASGRFLLAMEGRIGVETTSASNGASPSGEPGTHVPVANDDTAQTEGQASSTPAVSDTRATLSATEITTSTTGSGQGTDGTSTIAPKPTTTTTTTTVESSPAACTVNQATRVLSGAQSEQYKEMHLEAESIIDSTGASWLGVHDYPVRLGGGERGCWFGGNIRGSYPDTDSWDRMHDTAGFSISLPDFLGLGVRVHNYGDAINITDNAQGFVIRQAHLSYIRDDCIENDRLHAGILEDSLLDGCYTALSARRHSGDTQSDGRDNVWIVRRSLIRLQPMPTVYKGEAPGHGRFFKWDKNGLGPQLAFHDNILRVDQLPASGDLRVPDGILASCSNNIIVWLGEGEFPDPLPDCFTVTTDRSVWDNAVAQWKVRFGRYD